MLKVQQITIVSCELVNTPTKKIYLGTEQRSWEEIYTYQAWDCCGYLFIYLQGKMRLSLGDHSHLDKLSASLDMLVEG